MCTRLYGVSCLPLPLSLPPHLVPLFFVPGATSFLFLRQQPRRAGRKRAGSPADRLRRRATWPYLECAGGLTTPKLRALVADRGMLNDGSGHVYERERKRDIQKRYGGEIRWGKSGGSFRSVINDIVISDISLIELIKLETTGHTRFYYCQLRQLSKVSKVY